MSTFCSCIICKKELSIKGFHSHFIRLHTIDGNIATKQYGKLSTFKNKQNADLKNNFIRIQYANIPSHCKECDCCLPYEKRSNSFCSSSCSATYNNNLRSVGGYKMSINSRQKISEKNTGHLKPIYTKIACCKICKKWFAGTNKTCSLTCRNMSFSLTAKKTKLGGNKNTRAYGWYYSKFAGKVWLESSYEYKVAKELDDNNIRWIRPSFLFYTLNNIKKRYYPDFFLEDFNIFLDPKNDYLIIQDLEKIECVRNQNNVKVLVLTKFQLSWKIIHSLL
jgi:hypothetical protein